MRPRALHGRDALPDADRFRYQIRGVSDNSDTEDLVSLGSSSIGNTASDNLKVLELEAELAKIKEVSMMSLIILTPFSLGYE